MMGEKAGVPTQLSKAVHDVNQRQRERFFDKILTHFKAKENSGGLSGKTLGFWGIAFKPKTDDIREAPSITLMRKALGYGAKVKAFDPVALENAKHELGQSVELVGDMYQAATGVDGLVVCTDWDEFKSPDWGRVKSAMKGRVIFDGRNLYKTASMREQGMIYYSIGRAVIDGRG
jgi:UDPglucose 6-dehydrogenase